ncbi:hypothetical protein FKM82_024967 [Ascaphus truei]
MLNWRPFKQAKLVHVGLVSDRQGAPLQSPPPPTCQVFRISLLQHRWLNQSLRQHRWFNQSLLQHRWLNLFD